MGGVRTPPSSTRSQTFERIVVAEIDRAALALRRLRLRELVVGLVGAGLLLLLLGSASSGLLGLLRFAFCLLGVARDAGCNVCDAGLRGRGRVERSHREQVAADGESHAEQLGRASAFEKMH